MLRYDAGDFEGAIEDLQEALSTDPNNADYGFYLGISLMQTSQFEKAITTFSEIPESNRFSRVAIWYSGLSHLKTGDIQNARLRFNNLSDSPGSYREDATTILKSLD
jgi:Flp pilus assembly protein TadD